MASSESNPVVFFDITIGGSPKGRIEMELFADVVPKTAEVIPHSDGSLFVVALCFRFQSRELINQWMRSFCLLLSSFFLSDGEEFPLSLYWRKGFGTVRVFGLRYGQPSNGYIVSTWGPS